MHASSDAATRAFLHGRWAHIQCHEESPSVATSAGVFEPASRSRTAAGARDDFHQRSLGCAQRPGDLVRAAVPLALVFTRHCINVAVLAASNTCAADSSLPNTRAVGTTGLLLVRLITRAP